MKRLSLSALALLALFGLLLTGCPNGNTPEPEPEPDPTPVTVFSATDQSVTLDYNPWDGGSNQQGLLGGAVSAAIPSGSTLSITLVGTTDIALSGYQFVLINQGATNDGWTESSGYTSVASSVAAGGSVGIDLDVTTTAAVAKDDYLKLCL